MRPDKDLDTPIVPSHERFSASTRRSATFPRELPGLGRSGEKGRVVNDVIVPRPEPVGRDACHPTVEAVAVQQVWQ
jgi:hypothetical protein